VKVHRCASVLRHWKAGSVQPNKTGTLLSSWVEALLWLFKYTIIL